MTLILCFNFNNNIILYICLFCFQNDNNSEGKVAN